MGKEQVVIKVREWILHKGLIPKVIPCIFRLVFSRLLLARCVQRPSNFLPTTCDQMAGKSFYMLFFYSQKTFHSRDACFLHSAAFFFDWAFLYFVLVLLFILLLFYLDLRSFIQGPGSCDTGNIFLQLVSQHCCIASWNPIVVRILSQQNTVL